MFVKDKVGTRTFSDGILEITWVVAFDVNLHVVNSFQRILMYANPLSWYPVLKVPVMIFSNIFSLTTHFLMSLSSSSSPSLGRGENTLKTWPLSLYK